jgi:hypothetical protein
MGGRFGLTVNFEAVKIRMGSIEAFIADLDLDAFFPENSFEVGEAGVIGSPAENAAV